MRPGQQLHDADRGGRGRLLRYCARAPFTMDRPRDPERLLYESTKARPEQERSAAPDAAGTHRPPRRLVPPQRVHRHRYFGVLTRTAAHGKFPRRSRTAAPGRKRIVSAGLKSRPYRSIRFRTRQFHDFSPQRIIISHLSVELGRRARRRRHTERLQTLLHIR